MCTTQKANFSIDKMWSQQMPMPNFSVKYQSCLGKLPGFLNYWSIGWWQEWITVTFWATPWLLMMTPKGTESKAESMEPLDNCANSNRGGGRKLLPHRSVISVRHKGLWMELPAPHGPYERVRSRGCLFHFSSVRVECMANRSVYVLRPPPYFRQ